VVVVLVVITAPMGVQIQDPLLSRACKNLDQTKHRGRAAAPRVRPTTNTRFCDPIQPPPHKL